MSKGKLFISLLVDASGIKIEKYFVGKEVRGSAGDEAAR